MPAEGTLEDDLARRTVLRGLGTALLGTAGCGAIGTVGAQSGEDVTTLDIRETGDQTLPVVDELLVFAHGWYGSSVGPDQAAALADALAASGYEPDETVALVYQADAADRQDAFEQARAAATEFAPIVETFYDEGGGSLRLAGHSLGGRVVLETLSELADGYEVETVVPMGAAAVGSMVAEGGRWSEGIAERATAVRNYHSENDDVVLGDFGSEGDTALGAEGAPDDLATPETYTDVDVTDDVSGHGGYTSSSALGEDLAQAIAEQGSESTPCQEAGAADGAQLDDGTWVCDVNGDGSYRDVDASGDVTSQDLADFFANQHRDPWDSRTDRFDFDGDGVVGQPDVVDLFHHI